MLWTVSCMFVLTHQISRSMIKLIVLAFFYNDSTKINFSIVINIFILFNFVGHIMPTNGSIGGPNMTHFIHKVLAQPTNLRAIPNLGHANPLLPLGKIVVLCHNKSK